MSDFIAPRLSNTARPMLRPLGAAMRAHDPLWDIGYNASRNFHWDQRESSCHAAVQPDRMLHSVWRKHDDTNFLFFFSRSHLIDAVVPTGIPFRQIR
ncbi:hypothetical protein JQ574_32405 [Bradyrhizobium sp. AUGA SZCCT0158]|uniref:hypothetical protein n=1 Tax=Bradyrhizobium sp. AUGA SZCCT0158 TaxID=2807661 RepID=UPI001BA72207|nr:hypothetical protein [Bradyrhizobium sp. AUGA SZCCT0158]MBR1200708.1 hypothetical protein [Bradyrhizobium sp. AUGA SZCCT0158]